MFAVSSTHRAATWLLAGGAPSVTPPPRVQELRENWTGDQGRADGVRSDEGSES